MVGSAILFLFVSWVSLILCFADSFCFVKSVPAGIPELGIYSFVLHSGSLFLCFADFCLLCKIQCLGIPALKIFLMLLIHYILYIFGYLVHMLRHAITL